MLTYNNPNNGAPRSQRFDNAPSSTASLVNGLQLRRKALSVWRHVDLLGWLQSVFV
jgi:hypothetical protein